MPRYHLLGPLLVVGTRLTQSILENSIGALPPLHFMPQLISLREIPLALPSHRDEIVLCCSAISWQMIPATLARGGSYVIILLEVGSIVVPLRVGVLEFGLNFLESSF